MTQILEPRLLVDHVQEALPSGRHDALGPEPSSASALSRRVFLGQMRGVTVATLATRGGVALVSGSNNSLAHAAAMPPGDLQTRCWQAYRIRRDAAIAHGNLPLPGYPTNGDEALQPTGIASFTKGLPHNDLLEIEPMTSVELLQTVTTSWSAACDAMPWTYGAIARTGLVVLQPLVDHRRM